MTLSPNFAASDDARNIREKNAEIAVLKKENERLLKELAKWQATAVHMAATDRRCPECNLNWALFPPVKIHEQPLVRCVECKFIYAEDGSKVDAD